MAKIHWAAPVSGDFSDAADWTGGVVPGSADKAVLGADATPYTVTAVEERVSALRLALNATLAIDGPFTASSAVTNQGQLDIAGGGTLTLQGSITNAGQVSLTGADNYPFATQAGVLAVSGSVVLGGGGSVTLGNGSAPTSTFLAQRFDARTGALALAAPLA